MVINCCAMGRNSVEATNAFLIRAVRAMRCALVPRLWRALRRAAALEAGLCLLVVLVAEVFLVCVAEDLLEVAAGLPVPCPNAGPSKIAAAKRPAAPRANSLAGLIGVFGTIMVPM